VPYHARHVPTAGRRPVLERESPQCVDVTCAAGGGGAEEVVAGWRDGLFGAIITPNHTLDPNNTLVPRHTTLTKTHGTRPILPPTQHAGPRLLERRLHEGPHGAAAQAHGEPVGPAPRLGMRAMHQTLRPSQPLPATLPLPSRPRARQQRCVYQTLVSSPAPVPPHLNLTHTLPFLYLIGALLPHSLSLQPSRPAAARSALKTTFLLALALRAPVFCHTPSLPSFLAALVRSGGAKGHASAGRHPRPFFLTKGRGLEGFGAICRPPFPSLFLSPSLFNNAVPPAKNKPASSLHISIYSPHAAFHILVSTEEYRL
jgi:hypothetical protein